VGSKFLIGAGAWLLGAASATFGSLYAIAQLGQGLGGQHTTQVSVAMVNAELAKGSAAQATATAPSPSPSASPTISHAAATRRSGPKHHATPPVTYSSKVLTSDGGTAEAACGSDGARLLYEIAAQGFEVDHFEPGPSAVASVTFFSSSIGVIMKVACNSAGVPVAQVSEFQPTAWGPHHDE